jgi:type III secretion protein Q
MTESKVEPGLDATLDATLEELPLRVVCQVGSVEVSLAELRALGPGSVMQLAPQRHDGVSLMVNGRCIGQGQLVTIGDGLGVRLLSIATP